MMKTLIARSKPILYGRASILLAVALLLPFMVMAPVLDAAPRAQPVLLAMAAERPEEMIGVIVQKLVKDTSPSTSSGHGVEELVARLGGVVTKDLRIINAFAAELPGKSVPELARAAGVRWVSLDAPMVQAGWNASGGVWRVRDEFSTVSYGNNDGIVNWTGNWIEIEESDGPEVGDVRVTTFLGGTKQGLRIQNASKGAQREADLSSATSAELSFEYRRKGFDGSSDCVVIEISADGGASWAELDRFQGPGTDPDVQLASYDISSYMSSNTMVRFVSSSSLSNQDKLYIDNIQIEYTLAGGSDDGFDAVEGESALAGDGFYAGKRESMLAGGGGETVRDEFNVVSYSNNDGTQSWAGDWIETGDEGNPYFGDVRIISGYLRVKDDDRAIQRQVNLAGAVSAVLTLEYSRSELDEASDYVAVEVSADGGASWTELDRFAGPATDSYLQTTSYDISSFASSNTTIRFVTSSSLGDWDKVYFDNVQVAYTVGCDACIDTSNLANAYIRTIGADQLWNDPPYVQGQGITVAVVDSGIAPHGDLLDGAENSRVVAQVDFSGGQSPPDDYNGHGSHVAGTIAGSGAKSGGTYIGVAPKVNLVDVKVTDDQGASTTSDVVAGLQWIYDNKDVYNIRVVNISLNSSVPESYHTSPLDAAVEILWFNRIVVVVSAGNNGAGTDDGILYPPANDPFVITVGATDDMDTADTGDDVLASFSGYGTTEAGFAKPDLVAPGTDIISLLASDDCNLVIAHPAHAVGGPAGNYYFRMSGTSMASSVTAGAVALLLQDEPDLTPDQVKYRLMATAGPFDGTEPGSTGAGYLDIYAAVHGTTTASANIAKITFTSHRAGNYEIYVMNADGSYQTRLTNNAASDDRPAWSPDGSQIAFASDRDGNWEIYVMDADGSNPINLTNNASNDRYPVWSPDGSQIAFYRYYPDNWEIYVMDADGANQTRLTFNTVSDSYPAWSPDGSQIAFHSDRDGNYEIYVMGADGSNQTNVTNNGAEDGAPAWSPDGSQIVFRSMRDGNKEIYVMGADGSNPTRLTNIGATDNDPAWSPDGSQIAFHSDRDGNYEIYVMNADGTNPTRLSNSAANDLEPAWSPGIAASQLLWTGPDPVAWDSVNWNSVNWNSVNWNSVNWNSVNWNSVNWNSVHWDD